MIFNFPKTLMVLLLCLTFVGQAMASTVMSYHMMSMGNMNGQAQTQQSSNMDHSGHHMMNVSTEATSGSNSSAIDSSASNSSDIDSSANSSKDCCEKNCNCFTGGCASIAVLSKNMVNDPVMDFSAKITSVSSLAQSQRLTSLYRPPILS